MIELQSTITCPHCGHRHTETMPTDFCQFFYDCKGCAELLRPKQDLLRLLLVRHGTMSSNSGGWKRKASGPCAVSFDTRRWPTQRPAQAETGPIGVAIAGATFWPAQPRC